MSLVDSCLFCKIIQGTVPCHKLIETAHSLAFMDVFPLSHGHVLVIPKIHGQFLHQIPDEHLHDCISTVKMILNLLKYALKSKANFPINEFTAEIKLNFNYSIDSYFKYNFIQLIYFFDILQRRTFSFLIAPNSTFKRAQVKPKFPNSQSSY